MKSQGQKWILPTLAVVFLAPLLLAWAVYHQPEWRPPAGLQHGELLDPSQPPIAPAGNELLLGHWTLLYRNAGPCEADCRDLLDTLRRVRLAQDRSMRRVQRLLLLPESESYTANEPDLRMAPAENWNLPAGSVYLVDPRGVSVLRYRPGFDTRGLIKDLQRLLRRTGEG